MSQLDDDAERWAEHKAHHLTGECGEDCPWCLDAEEDDDFWHDDNDDQEPIGSCDNCDIDVYEDTGSELPDGTRLCEQCTWWVAQARE